MPPPGSSPRLTADCIITLDGDPRRIVLVRRRSPPHGWALPGGFVEWGETVEAAAIREMKEETGLDVILVRQFHTYSDPGRDPRGHTVTVVFIAEAAGTPVGADDAAEARAFAPEEFPSDIAFDHRAILDDYLKGRHGPAGTRGD